MATVGKPSTPQNYWTNLPKVPSVALAVLVLTGCGEGFRPEPRTDNPGPRAGWLQGTTWQDQHLDTKKAAVDVPNVALFGDSLFQGFGGPKRRVEAPGADSFAQHLAPMSTANYGIAGDSAAHLWFRIRDGLLEPTPRVAIILIGANDVGGSGPSAVVRRIRTVYEEIKKKVPAPKVGIVQLLPRGDSMAQASRAAEVALDQWAKENPDVKFRDFSAIFRGPDGRLREELFESDRLHLSPLGYAKWAPELAKFIRELDPALPSGTSPARSGSGSPGPSAKPGEPPRPEPEK